MSIPDSGVGYREQPSGSPMPDATAGMGLGGLLLRVFIGLLMWAGLMYAIFSE